MDVWKPMIEGLDGNMTLAEVVLQLEAGLRCVVSFRLYV